MPLHYNFFFLNELPENPQIPSHKKKNRTRLGFNLLFFKWEIDLTADKLEFSDEERVVATFQPALLIFKHSQGAGGWDHSGDGKAAGGSNVQNWHGSHGERDEVMGRGAG